MSPTVRRIAWQRAARLFDLAAVALLLVVALAIDTAAFTWLSFTNILAMRVALVNLIYFAVYLSLCSAIFANCGMYRSQRLARRNRRLREVFLAVTLIVAIPLALRGPLELGFATNRFLLIFWFLTFTFLALAREVVQQLLYFVRSRGRNLRSIVIIGEGSEITDLAERIESDTSLGYRVLRIIDAKET